MNRLQVPIEHWLGPIRIAQVPYAPGLAMRCPTICLLVLLLLVCKATALSSTDQVAWPGKPLAAQPNWPAGVLDLVNDPLRAEGWRPWFSQWPNDVTHYTFKVQDTAEVNRLLKKLASIKAPILQLRLRPDKEARSLGFTTVLKEGNGAAVLFSIGDQQTINEWYQRLPEQEPGVRKFGVRTLKRAPAAMPPTLTLFARHTAIDLGALQIPANVEVLAELPEASPAENQTDPFIKKLTDFVASHQNSQSAAPAQKRTESKSD